MAKRRKSIGRRRRMKGRTKLASIVYRFQSMRLLIGIKVPSDLKLLVAGLDIPAADPSMIARIFHNQRLRLENDWQTFYGSKLKIFSKFDINHSF